MQGNIIMRELVLGKYHKQSFCYFFLNYYFTDVNHFSAEAFGKIESIIAEIEKHVRLFKLTVTAAALAD